MSYMLPHLFNGWQVDQAILSEEDKVSLKEELDLLNYQFIEVSADIAMLQEMLDKEIYLESDDDEKYDPLDEVFTAGDY